MSEKILQFGRPANQPARRLIPQRLVSARKAVPLTQTELAAKVGLTRQAISAYEQGAKHPDGSTMFAIAEAVEQPVSYFFSDMPEPFGPFSARTFLVFWDVSRRRSKQSNGSLCELSILE